MPLVYNHITDFNFKTRILKNLSCLFAVLAVFLCASISYGQTFPIRIDCGSLVDTNENGTVWLADQYYQNAEKKYSGHGNLTLGEPYESVRYSKLPTGLPTFSYSIPVPNGNYELTLHFVEAYFGISGQGGNGSRIFNVNIEGVQHNDLTNLDIHAEVGPNAILTRTYSVSVNDGNITIDFASVNGADAIISAIEVDQQINIDDQAPNIPTGLTVNSFDHQSASISWNASADNGGGNVAGYFIYNNGTQIAASTGTSTTLTGLSEQTLYQLSINAYDDATNSNISSQSTPTVNFTTLSSNGDPDNTGGHWTKTGSNIHYTGGNVGIGTVNSVPTNGDPNYKLAVKGSIRAEEIKVETGWADYVFFNDYKLPTLQEVEQHIEEKGHLINIPSAAEVEANGVELGEMNKLLLEKIEELTLYMIQMKKEINQLKKAN